MSTIYNRDETGFRVYTPHKSSEKSVQGKLQNKSGHEFKFCNTEVSEVMQEESKSYPFDLQVQNQKEPIDFQKLFLKKIKNLAFGENSSLASQNCTFFPYLSLLAVFM